MRESMPKKKAGEFVALPYREVPAFMAKLRSQQGIAARCLELALLTASRTSEVLYATWSEFHVDESVWRIPAERMKLPESHTVYLSQQAIDVIEQQRGLDASIVFPSLMLTAQPMSNMAMLTARPHGCASTDHGARPLLGDVLDLGERNRSGAPRRHRSLSRASGRR